MVEDATHDPRFNSNPLVTGDPNIRFYAGAPLCTSEGHAIGTLCVIDREPRKISREQSQLLQDIAAIGVDELDFRRQSKLALETEVTTRQGPEESYRESEERYSGILDIAIDAIISVDQTPRILLFNKGAETIFGYTVVRKQS